MIDFEKINTELYNSQYMVPREGDYSEIWNKIKNNKEILEWAIQKTRDKFDAMDTVRGPAICDSILINYEDVDLNIYTQLVSLVYSNTDIARIVLDDSSNDSFSFLLMALRNKKLKLTEEQKIFAVSEAMNKVGTTKYQKEIEKYSAILEKEGITDDKSNIINIGCVNPISAKTKSEYMNSLYHMINNTQVHGIRPFDIRYHILKNNNWNGEEKKVLVHEFYASDEYWSETLDQFKWGVIVIDDKISSKRVSFSVMCSLYNDYYDDYNKDITDEYITNRIWEEVKFVEEMYKLRPPKVALEFNYKTSSDKNNQFLKRK